MALINSQQPASGQMLREEGLPYNMADAAEMSMGGKGCVLITTTAKTDSAAGQAFVALHCITDCVFSAYVVRAYAPVLPTNGLNGITFPAGTVLYGQFTSITLASGICLLITGSIMLGHKLTLKHTNNVALSPAASVLWLLNADATQGVGKTYVWKDGSVWTDANVWKD